MPDNRFVKDDSPRFRQGDFLRDLVVTESISVEGDEGAFQERQLPYCVILSQDCDLEHDFNSRSKETRLNHDKFLPSILLSPAYRAEEFRQGEHLKELGLAMERFGSDNWKRVKGNQTYRYHFVERSMDFQFPDLVIDFKHFFTVPRDVFYREFETCYLASLANLFREDLSNRFAYYLSRIGLPEPM